MNTGKRIVVFGLDMFQLPTKVGDYQIKQIPSLKYVSPSKRIIRTILFRLNSSKSVSFYNVEEVVSTINNNDILIVFDALPIYVVNYLSDVIKDFTPKKIIYFWNVIRNISLFKLTSDWKCCSFDFGDSIKYNVKYVSTFYLPETINNQSISSDIYFAGKNKGRFKTIRSLEDKFAGKPIKLDFHYVSSLSKILPFKYEGPMPYDTIRQGVSSARSILDITQNGQIGLTQRFMESLFYNKKILTNNKNVMYYKFYTNSNILILDDSTSYEDVVMFLNKECKHNESALIDFYRFDHWLQRVLSPIQTQYDIII